MKHGYIAAVSVLSVVLMLGAGLAVLNIDNSEAADTSGKTYNVGLVEGATYSYTPSFSISNVSISLSGTAASWLSVTNGTISGTAPSVSESGKTSTYALTITATTTKPTQQVQQFINFTVYDTLSGTLSVSNGNSYVGGTPSFTDSCNYSSGVTYSLSGAPSGITINSSNGVISGSVTGDSSGTVSGKDYTVKVTMKHTASGQTITKQVSLKVFSKLAQNTAGVNSNGTDLYVVNGSSVPTASSDVDYNKVVSNITSGVTYSLKSNNSLPSGLTLNSNGTVTGTCTAMGDKTVTIIGTQTSTGQTAEHTFTVHCVAKLSFDSVPTGGIVAEAA